MIYAGTAYAPGSWLSRVIAWFQLLAHPTAQPLSHAFFLLKDPIFGWEVLGAEARGFYPMIATSWAPSYVVDLFEVPGLEVALAKNKAALGAPYDFPGLVGMTWVEAMWWAFKRRVKNPLSHVGAWFCSAIVAQVLETDGIDCPGEPRSVDPVTVGATLAAGGFKRANFAEVIAS